MITERVDHTFCRSRESYSSNRLAPKQRRKEAHGVVAQDSRAALPLLLGQCVLDTVEILEFRIHDSSNHLQRATAASAGSGTELVLFAASGASVVREGDIECGDSDVLGRWKAPMLRTVSPLPSHGDFKGLTQLAEH